MRHKPRVMQRTSGNSFTRVLFATTCLAAALAAAGARADDFFPVTEADLHLAIADANAAAGPHTIWLTPGGAYLLSSALPDIAVVGGLTIEGQGATIDADGDSFTPRRVLTIAAGVEIELVELTLTGGYAAGSLFAPRGGAILNFGTLTLTGCTVTGNHAVSFGGGICNGAGTISGTLNVVDSSISGNTAGSHGGGVLNNGPMTVSGSTIDGNAAGGSGGGVWNSFTTTSISVSLSVTNSSISGNTAGGFGGGLYNNNQADTDVESCTLAGNTALDGGGVFNNNGLLDIANCDIRGNAATGIYSSGGLSLVQTSPVTIRNSTITGNSGVLAGGIGEGITTFNGDLTLINCTVTENTATDAVSGTGGIDYGGGDLLLHNTIVAGNSWAADPSDLAGIADASSSHNLIGDAASSGGLLDGVNGNIVGIDPALVLAPLPADNGGLTWTHALVAFSPAIDAGNPLMAAGLDFDQRGPGFPRISGGSVDIGAYEVQQVALYDGFGVGFWKSPAGQAFWLDTPYTTSMTVGEAFGPDYPGAYGGTTLLDALSLSGGNGLRGAERNLLRQAVAALLNASHPDIDFPRTPAEVIADVRAAVGSASRSIMLDLKDDLEADNTAGE